MPQGLKNMKMHKIQPKIDEMRTVSPQWNSLIDHWAELEGMLNDNAPEMYDRMKELGC